MMLMVTKRAQVACPACGQGWVLLVRVKSTGVRLLLCEECESTWLAEEDIGTDRVTNFVNYMQAHGDQGLWTEIEQLDE